MCVLDYSVEADNASGLAFCESTFI